MNTGIVVGSLADVAEKAGVSIAESFLNCEAMVLFDSSGSMGTPDSRGGRSRYEVALEELATLQASMPGRVAVIVFSDTAEFVPGGVPPLLGDGTNLAGALRFAKVADSDDMQFVVVSDGVADDPNAALAEARALGGHLDCVYVGPETDREGGRAFLQRLSAASGGQTVTADRAQELAAKIETLLLRA